MNNGCLITIDVEDHGRGDRAPRFVEALAPLLRVLRSNDLRATFFVVGNLASGWRDELRTLRDEGHEIGLHGHTHRFVNRIGPTEFRDDLARGVDAVGEVLGSAPVGYRAPYFSITKETPWAPDLLQSAGFTYSSSVLPVWNPQSGFPGAPKAPFRWSNGLIEFPVPVVGVGCFGLPLLGGAYVRLVPAAVVRLAAARARHTVGAWTYAHPYDFDVDEPYTRLDGQQWWVTRLLFLRRRLMLDRVIGLSARSAKPLGELASDPTFVSRLALFD